MNEEAAFLRAICENPDDDTPRLVFADWLQEQGGAVNAAWAAGIRAQVWLARGANDDALQFQACVFDSHFGQRKLLERLGFRSELLARWERGFPSEVSGHFREVRELWPELAGRVPVRTIRVYDVNGTTVAEFVTWPGLPMLRELSFGIEWEPPTPGDVLPLLAACADLKGLVSLELGGTRLTESGLAAILDSPHLAGLKTCNLGYGYGSGSLSERLRDRFRERFGPDSLTDEDAIPF